MYETDTANPSPFEVFARHEDNLKAMYAFHNMYQFKKIIEKEFRRKISWDQLGEMVDVIHSNPPVDEMVERITRILAEVR